MASYNYNGMVITEELSSMLEKAIRREGSQAAFAGVLGIERVNITRWMRHGKQANKYIAWSIWPIIRQYLLDNNEIDIDDPRYMTRSQLVNRAAEAGEVLTEDEKRILSRYRMLDAILKKVAEDTINSLVKANCKKTPTSESVNEAQ